MRMILLAAGFAMLGGAASAGAIESACLQSNRAGISRALCGCIQAAANLTLTSSDQRRAAKFFRNPDLAQKTRQDSDGARTDFWDRYKNFGATAEAYCSAS